MTHYTLPNYSKMALIIIDMQNDFSLPTSKYAIPGTMEVIPNIQRLLSCFRKANFPIIHVIRLYKESGDNVDLCRRELIEKGAQIVTPNSEGAQIVRSLMPTSGIEINADILLKGGFQNIKEKEWVMYKPRWGAFFQTKLEHFLKEQKVDTLLFCGCNFPNCPRTSIYEASERDFKTILAIDAVSGIYERGANEMENIGVNLMLTREIVDKLS